MVIRLSAFSDEADSSLTGQLKALKENEIGYMDIRNVSGENVADMAEDTAKLIKSDMDAAGVKMWMLGTPLCKSKLSQPAEYEEERLRRLIKLAKIFECDKMRVFSFFTTDYAADRAEIIERMIRLTDIAQSGGVTLYHENEKEIYGDTVEHVVDLLDNVPKLKSIYDPANFLQCNQNIDIALDTLLSRTEHFHIKDVILATGELVPSGYGDGKIGEMLSRIAEDCVITIEPHLAVFDGYSNIDAREMKTKFRFNSNREAFDTAVKAVKEILLSCGFKSQNGVWVK